jgi:hypothetical protein
MCESSTLNNYIWIEEQKRKLLKESAVIGFNKICKTNPKRVECAISH